MKPYLRRPPNRKWLALQDFRGARSAGLEPATFSVRSHSTSVTWADMEGQEETKQRFYRYCGAPEGQGATSGCGQIAVKKLETRLDLLG